MEAISVRLCFVELLYRIRLINLVEWLLEGIWSGNQNFESLIKTYWRIASLRLTCRRNCVSMWMQNTQYCAIYQKRKCKT